MDQRKIMEGLIARIAIGVFGLLTIALLLLAVFNDHGMLAVHRANETLKELKAANEALIQNTEKTRKEIHDLRTDPATIEKNGRERLNFVKPGEVILVTPEAPAKK